MQSRHTTVPVNVGGLLIGGGAPIAVQSMTNTDTVDIKATTQQIIELAEAGSELVRITVNTEEAAQAVPYIRDQVRAKNCSVPIIGDFHYNGHRLLTQYPACAEALAKYRINPGNVGFGQKRDAQFAMMIDVALKHDKPVRIGVNWGSLDQSVLVHLMDENAKRPVPQSSQAILREALVVSALSSAAYAEELGLPKNRIIIACKTSHVQDLVAVYLELAKRSDYALHLGLTEAGMGSKGIVASSVALGILLQQGIGDTIRASLTPEPGGDRRQEVLVCQEILQSLSLRHFTPMVSACPGCGRTTSSFYQELAASVQGFLRKSMPEWRLKYPGVENLTVAVMGCVVNGPGESKHANIGISLPGTGEEPVAPIFIDGQKVATLRGDNIAAEFLAMVQAYVEKRYGAAVV